MALILKKSIIIVLNMSNFGFFVLCSGILGLSMEHLFWFGGHLPKNKVIDGPWCLHQKEVKFFQHSMDFTNTHAKEVF